MTVRLIAARCRLWQWFSTVDTDRSGAITATELGMLRIFHLSRKFCQVLMRFFGIQERALINGDWTRECAFCLNACISNLLIRSGLAFDLDTVKMLMQIFVRFLSLIAGTGQVGLNLNSRILIAPARSISMRYALHFDFSALYRYISWIVCRSVEVHQSEKTSSFLALLLMRMMFLGLAKCL